MFLAPSALACLSKKSFLDTPLLYGIFLRVQRDSDHNVQKQIWKQYNFSAAKLSAYFCVWLFMDINSFYSKNFNELGIPSSNINKCWCCSSIKHKEREICTFFFKFSHTYNVFHWKFSSLQFSFFSFIKTASAIKYKSKYKYRSVVVLMRTRMKIFIFAIFNFFIYKNCVSD